MLARSRRPDPPSPTTLPAGSEIATPNGQIAGALRLLALDLRRLVATYELLVANQTNGPLAAFCYAVGVGDPGTRMRWSAVTIPPHSSVALPVEIELPKRGKLRRIVGELHADGAQLVVDAEPPALRRARAVEFGALAGAAGLFLAGAAALSLAHPRVAALAVPDQVESGKPFQVAYALGPTALRGDYSVLAGDGREVAHGALDPRGGVLTLSVPAAKTEQRYAVRLWARNPLGSASSDATVLAAATRAPHLANVAGVHMPAVWLDQDIVTGGAPIVVHYVTDAKAGDVKLLDQDGTERAAALLNRHGSTIVVAPMVESAQDFRLVVVARRGGALTQSQIAVRVTPGYTPQAAVPPAAAPPSEPSVSSDSALPPAAGAAAFAAGDPIVLARTTFSSGETIVVTVLQTVPNLRVALLDDSGQEIQSVDVVAGRDRVLLEAPNETSVGHFTVVATYGPGTSEQSVIHSIVVRAR